VAADRPGLVLGRDVEVVKTDGAVMARLPGGEVFDFLDVFAEMLTSIIINRFQMFADRPHTPRVKIDNLVVCRERWQFSPADLGFAAEKDEAARFVRAREWATTLGIPRYVFVKSATEEKPVYVDFASPVYVNVLAKMVRRANADERLSDKTISVVEMLPAHDDLWLADHEGNRYTSEFRFTLVDDRPARGPAASAMAMARLSSTTGESAR
jgi:Lantibiotic dehydratase, N terminus